MYVDSARQQLVLLRLEVSPRALGVFGTVSGGVAAVLVCLLWRRFKKSAPALEAEGAGKKRQTDLAAYATDVQAAYARLKAERRAARAGK